VKAIVSNQQDFFPEIDPRKKPSKPDPVNYQDEDEVSAIVAVGDFCLTCNSRFNDHSSKQLIQCALKELRGESPKGQ